MLNQKQKTYGDSENPLFTEEECREMWKKKVDDRVKIATSLLLFTDRGDVGNFIHLPINLVYSK